MHHHAFNHSRLITVLMLACPLMLISCATKLADVDTVKKNLAPTAQWHHQPTDALPSQETTQWWTSFNDPQLNELVAEGLAKNADLAAATWRMKTVFLQSGIVHANITPDVAVSFNENVSKKLDKGDPSSRNYSGAFNLNYELDFWGKLATLRKISDWNAQASIFSRQNVTLQLIGTITQLYWKIAYFNERLTLNSQSIAYGEQSLSLAKVRKEAGVGDDMEVIQAQQRLETQVAVQSTLLRQLSETRTAMAILFAQPSEWTIAHEPSKLPSAVPAIHATIPAEVLARRPALREAEEKLRASFASIDAMRRNYYPTIKLTSSISTGGTRELSDIMKHPVGALGYGLFLPFIQWNTTTLNIKVSESQYQEAVENFRMQLYKALKDVEDVLSNRSHYQEEGAHLRRSHELAGQAEKLAEVRYRSGQTSIKEWLDQQESRRNAESATSDNQLNQLITMTQFFQAIGGGVEGLQTNLTD